MDLQTFLLLLPILLASLTLHELAHAVVATRLGDPTPREDGRLTLNPIVHLDPLGTAMFAFTAFLSDFIFGWAKPVMVNTRSFRRPQQAMAVVAVAGPATNFLIGLGCLAALVHVELGEQTAEVVARSFQVNVALGIFNLIPIPPLDGSRIVGAFMGRETYARWSALDQYGILVLFGIIFIFRGEFSQVYAGAFERVLDVMLRIVGA